VKMPVEKLKASKAPEKIIAKSEHKEERREIAVRAKNSAISKKVKR
jgi:hypothetical protein